MLPTHLMIIRTTKSGGNRGLGKAWGDPKMFFGVLLGV